LAGTVTEAPCALPFVDQPSATAVGRAAVRRGRGRKLPA
jgi:hypothetical protein